MPAEPIQPIPTHSEPSHSEPNQPPLSRRERRAAKHGNGKIPVQRQVSAVVSPRQYAARRRG